MKNLWKTWRRQAESAALLVGLMFGRSAAQDLPRAGAPAPTSASSASTLQETGQAVRVLDDSCLGDRWVLLKSEANLGGPGRLMRIAAGTAGHRSTRTSAGIKGPTQATTIMIRTGDRLVVQEHTSWADGWLEAVALESAMQGQEFWARLQIGGKAVRVVAIAPGSVAFRETGELRP